MTIDDALLSARVLRPYYQRIISALVTVESGACPTFGVDKHARLYYSPKFLADLTADQAGYCIGAHEVEHLLRDHAGRRVVGSDAEAWNVAGDLEINDEPGVIEHLPCRCLHPAQPQFSLPEGLLAEEYFDRLPPPKKKRKKCTACAGGSGAGNPQPYEVAGDAAGTPGMTAAEMEAVRDAVAQDVVAHVAKHGRGSVPEGTLVWAEARAREPVVDWRRVLAAHIGRARAERGRSDYTWSRPSRRGRALGCDLPGSVRHPPRVSVVVDTSGSMYDLGESVLSEVRALTRSCVCRLWSCDAQPYRTRGADFRGGGGTDLRPAIARAAKEADLIVVITDGDTPWPDSAPACRGVVVLIGEPATPPPDYFVRITINQKQNQK